MMSEKSFQWNAPPSVVGVIGLGDMGLPIATHLHNAGHRVIGFDLKEERLRMLAAAGAGTADSLATVVRESSILLTSLPSSSAFLHVAGEQILPLARPGLRVLETGTTVPENFREMARRFLEQGVHLNDAPLSGGEKGARSRQLHVFFGGTETEFSEYQPFLERFAGSELLHHCGPVGAGQAMKGVNQLTMAFANATGLEVLAFAWHSGLDLAQVAEIFDGAPVAKMAEHALHDRANSQGVKFRELPYYLEEARKMGFHLPMTEALHAFCEKGKRVVVDDHREAPAFWHELTHDKRC